MRSGSRALLIVSLLIFGIVIAVLMGLIIEMLDDTPAQLVDAPEARSLRSRERVTVDLDSAPIRRSRPLPIAGRVVDAELAPVVGLELVLGSEIVTSDASGVFRFDAAVRHGTRPLSLRRDGHELARWEVHVGEVPVLPEEPRVEAAPWRLRWSVTLCDDAAPAESSPPLLRSRDDAVLRLGAVLVEERGASGTVHFHGSSRLPDGARLDVAVFFPDPVDIAESRAGERLVASTTPTHVAGGAFAGRFDVPDDFRFHSATYALHIFFSSTFGDLETIERWRAEYPDIPWERLGDYELVQAIGIGFPSEAIEEDSREREYFRESLAAAVGLKKVLEHRFFETQKLAKGWDPALLEARRAARQSWLDDGAVTPEGGFDEAAWRDFLDERWRPRVQELLDAHENRAERKYRNADERLGGLLGSLLEYGPMLSIMLYEHFGLSVHPRDFYFDEYQARGDAGLRKLMMAGHIETLERYCAAIGVPAQPVGQSPGGTGPERED